MVWIFPFIYLASNPFHPSMSQCCTPPALPVFQFPSSNSSSCHPFYLQKELLTHKTEFTQLTHTGANTQNIIVEAVSLAPGSPQAPLSETSCPASCTCSCPSTPSTSLLYTPRPSFEPTAPTGPPPSSYHVSYTEEQSSGQSYQPAGQEYHQQSSNSVGSNPTQDAGTLFYQRPEEEVEESSETTAAPEVTPYVQTYPSYSKPFTSFSSSSPPPPPAPAGYPSTSAPSFPPQVSLSIFSFSFLQQ